ncbi:hypothetical protein MKY95_07555 [Paenibacillus sp. FSL P4-0176]|uniref:hypothetical protein n=1 Tax=Paenibacillus sp. FSL P4-0176 TaxID=2921631 RepID=UPI0030CC9077
MIYHRKAETVRAIRLTDYSPALIEQIQEFTGGLVQMGRVVQKVQQPYLSVVVEKNYFKVLQGSWIVHSPEKGWRVYRHHEFIQEYEEGEHGQQSGDQVADGL